MSLIDLILNVAGLLLWFNWRSLRFDPLARRRPATLVGTLKSTERRSFGSWVFLAAIPVLLLVRAFLYWQIGAPADWTARLNLGLVVLAFPADHFTAALFFSAMSFLRFSALAFFWLLVIAILNRHVQEPDTILKLIRLQLGRVGHLPTWVQFILPLFATIILWMTVHPALAWIGIVAPAHSQLQVLGQGALLWVVLLISLKLLLPVVLMLYMLSSYVYLGHSPLWEFVATTSAGIMRPLHPQRLRSSKLDFAPLVGIVLIFLLLHTLPLLAFRFAAEHNVVVWPE
jgi:hypothetical protein